MMTIGQELFHALAQSGNEVFGIAVARSQETVDPYVTAGVEARETGREVISSESELARLVAEKEAEVIAGIERMTEAKAEAKL